MKVKFQLKTFNFTKKGVTLSIGFMYSMLSYGRLVRKLDVPAHCAGARYTDPTYAIPVWRQRKGEGVKSISLSLHTGLLCYGHAPAVLDHLDCLRRNCSFYTWNIQQLQDLNLIVCGHYCLNFLFHMYNIYKLNMFCRLFSSNTTENDSLTVFLFKKITEHTNKNENIIISVRLAFKLVKRKSLSNSLCTSVRLLENI